MLLNHDREQQTLRVKITGNSGFSLQSREEIPYPALTLKTGITSTDIGTALPHTTAEHTMIELEDGILVRPLKVIIAPLAPDDCGMSTQTKRTPVNPEHIKVVVDWMEANKGKYELQDKIERTY